MDQNVPLGGRSTRSLESLPDDVLITIFSRLSCLADLSSVVQASRSLHQCFQIHKRAVFLGMLSYDFIPVMRDAVIAATTPRVRSRWRRERQTRLAIQRYQSLEQGPRATAELRIDEIASVVRLKTAVWYFVDLFVEVRRHDLRQVSPAAASPLSSHERQRLSAAFLRYQLAVTLHPLNARMAEALEPYFSALAAWEAEQIHQAHVFVTQLCLAMESFQKNGTHEPLGEGQSERQYLNEYIYDLSLLYKVVKSALDNDAGLMSRVSEKIEERSLKSLHGSIGFLNASHDFPNERLGLRTHSDEAAEDLNKRRTLRSKLYLMERSMPALVDGPSVADPPFGWVDALDGLNCYRWGKDLPYSFPDSSTPDHYRKVLMILKGWKRLGFLFWDQSRVELLKSANPEYARGWLLDIWN